MFTTVVTTGYANVEFANAPKSTTQQRSFSQGMPRSDQIIPPVGEVVGGGVTPQSDGLSARRVPSSVIAR